MHACVHENHPKLKKERLYIGTSGDILNLHVCGFKDSICSLICPTVVMDVSWLSVIHYFASKLASDVEHL